MDERGFIEIEPIKPILFSQGTTTSFPPSFSYEIYPKNAGRTAARNIQFRATREAIGANEALAHSQQGIAWQQERLLTGLVPTATVPINNPMDKTIGPFTTASIPFVGHGMSPSNGLYFYIIGRIDYTDSFNIQHWKKFCFYIVNSRGDLWHCDYGNDEDNNPEILQ